MADCNDEDMTHSTTSSSSDGDDSWADFGEEIDMSVYDTKPQQNLSLLPTTSISPVSHIRPMGGTSNDPSIKTPCKTLTGCSSSSVASGQQTSSSGCSKSTGDVSSTNVTSLYPNPTSSLLPSTSGLSNSSVAIPTTTVPSVVPKTTSTNLAKPGYFEHKLHLMGQIRRDWDPLAYRRRTGDALSIHATNRIKKDLAAFFADPPENIAICNDDADMCLVHAVIVGPDDTPYEGGFFYFVIRFPTDYPFAPPQVRIMTTDGGQVRFNPNLYADGKVCLSILGTWNGPPWSSAQSLTSVLLSIQSLMCAKPFYNEPGFEKKDYEQDSIAYNLLIAYQTLRVAVCQALEGPQGMPPSLVEVMQQKFQDYYVNYRINATKLMEHNNKTLRNPFEGGMAMVMVMTAPATQAKANMIATMAKSMALGKPKPPQQDKAVGKAKSTTDSAVHSKPSGLSGNKPTPSGAPTTNPDPCPSLNVNTQVGFGATAKKKSANAGEFLSENVALRGVVLRVDELVERLKALWLKISEEPEPWDA